MKQSCLREFGRRQPLEAFALPPEDHDSCSAIGKQADGAAAAAGILSDYFSSMNALASFGTAKVGSDAKNLVSKTAAAVGAGSPEQDALGFLANTVTSAATSGYQLRSLQKDLPKASQDVNTVTVKLIDIVQKNYLDQLLNTEEKKLQTQYKEFEKAQTDPRSADVPPRVMSAEAALLLKEKWESDEQAIAAKRASARSLIAALQTLSKGFTTLAATSDQLRAKEIPALLDPYVAQMQTLVPQIQKAF